ncbi:transcription factor LBX1-like [Argopecten irradians]|uniref:transcription factor LBX1-like n=1 Tax=Argopecten irradians TaxID=31199 RepID=UPI003715F653
MKIMSTSSGISDSEDSCKDQYEPIRKLAMVQLQPPRNPNKPFTSFAIKDILGSSNNNNNNNNNNIHHRNLHLNNAINSRIVRPWDTRSSPGRDSELSSDAEEEEINVDDDDQIPSLKTVSPLDALMEMANKTFEGLETADAADAKRREQAALFGKHQPPKKRRKSRTAFTNQQIYELEKRFLYQKYLTPADRDEIAQTLGLTNAQVITWFQNRRAKLKRDLEELKNDVVHSKLESGDEDPDHQQGSDIDSDSEPSPAKLSRGCLDSDQDNSEKENTCLSDRENNNNSETEQDTVTS